MLTYKPKRTAAAALTAALATGLLTFGTWVYAASEDGASGEIAANAALRAEPAESQSEIVVKLLRAADAGSVQALWRLAHMYMEGREVARNQLLAFDYFSRIADQNAEADPMSPSGRLVADSFVNLAELHLEGIEGSPVVRNEQRAARLLIHAATYFAEPVAQYRLAIMYLEGRGVDQNTRRAVSWLMLAARKQHIAAQCVLGRLLFNGGTDGKGQIPPIRGAGLMWLEIAKRYADPATQGWIVAEHEAAFTVALPDEKAAALKLADRWFEEHAQTN